MYVCIYYTHIWPCWAWDKYVDHCGPLKYTMRIYAYMHMYAHTVQDRVLDVYCTHVSALVGLESPSSVYTDGIEDNSMHSSWEQESQLLRAGAPGLGSVRLCAARPSAPPLLLYSCSCLGRCYSLRNLEQLALTSPYSLVASTVHWLLSQDLSHYPFPSPVSGECVAAPGRPGRTVLKLWIKSLSHFPTSSFP